MSKFNRGNFYEKEVVNDILEIDILKNNFDLFEITRPTVFYRLHRTHIQRPDLLALKFYNDMDYWWILGKVNKIDDWWNDVNVGDVIRIPDVRDVQDFYLAVRSRRRNV